MLSPSLHPNTHVHTCRHTCAHTDTLAHALRLTLTHRHTHTHSLNHFRTAVVVPFLSSCVFPESEGGVFQTHGAAPGTGRFGSGAMRLSAHRHFPFTGLSNSSRSSILPLSPHLRAPRPACPLSSFSLHPESAQAFPAFVSCYDIFEDQWRLCCEMSHNVGLSDVPSGVNRGDVFLTRNLKGGVERLSVQSGGQIKGQLSPFD